VYLFSENFRSFKELVLALMKDGLTFSELKGTMAQEERIGGRL
jgi:hypothetical protein